MLKKIPDEASVTANSWTEPHIANRKLLYGYKDSDSAQNTEYIVLTKDSFTKWQDGISDNEIEIFKNNSDYYIFNNVEEAYIFKKK